jgi:hypothetical protein
MESPRPRFINKLISKHMVQIIDFIKRTNGEGKEFNILILQGSPEFITSTKTGNVYATARRVSITSTFDDNVCKSLIGTKYPGEIERVESEPYEFKIPESGEVVLLNHKYRYSPNPATIEENVFIN